MLQLLSLTHSPAIQDGILGCCLAQSLDEEPTLISTYLRMILLNPQPTKHNPLNIFSILILLIFIIIIILIAIIIIIAILIGNQQVVDAGIS